jgi:hypothetical protein
MIKAMISKCSNHVWLSLRRLLPRRSAHELNKSEFDKFTIPLRPAVGTHGGTVGNVRIGGGSYFMGGVPVFRNWIYVLLGMSSRVLSVRFTKEIGNVTLTFSVLSVLRILPILVLLNVHLIKISFIDDRLLMDL